ncbi:serine dehydratase subunit alpha family protein [Desulfosarcina sp.]|uniref:L-cysteine desulfidase family protein n=1 Tax=Desulfosarcina sp. TaxID=2027861 RepID=UPI0029BB6EC1|nr:L-serine ammonia-lyase, iron-sulfur-dependent, subunit alpha [Desulfosarcina sp.]MDX2451813.1 L-serine ammonia-lyase, iron-sulfur-dependent, subunit alpha [Desulfosarcina sp.]MDX2489597.1 L-serine ammonia-lyase, iron-sulfur-dependent, subunit alpha [Desulfosarcina sp.]
MTYTVKDILKIQVAPALGCTEPVAIALGAAAAVSLLPEKQIDEIEIWVDPNIYKNGLAVSIPGTGGLSGLDMASAVGAFGGDAALKLEVLDSVDSPAISAAQKIVKAGRVKVNLLRDQVGLFIKTIVKGNGHNAESVITGLHDNVVSLALDGSAIIDHVLLPKAGSSDGKRRLADLEEWLKGLSLDQLLELLDDLDDDDLKFLESGVQVNMRLADYGLKHGPGLGVGRTMERLVRQGLMKRDMITAARILASSAADARMSGVKLPAMSSAGSGNHGLTAILPIVAVEKFITVDHRTTLEAIGLSHIITAYVKAYTGRLSAICGCSVAAGAGATAGVTYLMGGTKLHIAGAIKNLAEDLAGVICDGAKGGCALKLATAAGTAVQASLFALQGVNVSATDGIIGRSSEDTMKNIGTLTTQGMIETDRTILNIMLDKQFSDV